VTGTRQAAPPGAAAVREHQLNAIMAELRRAGPAGVTLHELSRAVTAAPAPAGSGGHDGGLFAAPAAAGERLVTCAELVPLMERLRKAGAARMRKDRRSVTPSRDPVAIQTWHPARE
jgi:hypothetical protein